MTIRTIEQLILSEIEQFRDNKFASKAIFYDNIEAKCHQLACYGEHLLQWNRKMNLVGDVSEAVLVTKHIMDGLAIAPYLNDTSVLDFGTGAGLPGVPLAIMRPDIMFDLLDARSRRIEFIRYVSGALKLTNVQLFASRVEDYKVSVIEAEKVGQIVTRAVASLHLIVELTEHCLASDGQWLVMKGIYPEKELQEIANANKQYKVESLSINHMIEERHLVIMQSLAPNFGQR